MRVRDGIGITEWWQCSFERRRGVSVTDTSSHGNSLTHLCVDRHSKNVSFFHSVLVAAWQCLGFLFCFCSCFILGVVVVAVVDVDVVLLLLLLTLHQDWCIMRVLCPALWFLLWPFTA